MKLSLIFKMIDKQLKKTLEENPVAFATLNNGKPHCIAVTYVKIKDDKIVITNNYMKTTIENIKRNNNVSLCVWNKNWEGYRINGEAEYFEEGEWYDFIKSIKGNENEPCKGAIVIKINEIRKLS